MGQGASAKGPDLGVTVNPRLQYAATRSKLENKNILIDAPALVKLQHGTIRYRYDKEKDPTDIEKRIEKPHEGDERAKKHGYFYHAKLQDFSEYADPSKEESWKFCYVYKGANKTKQKELYYVFGKGLKTNADGIIEPNSRILPETNTNTFYKYHGHFYYNLDLYIEETNLDEHEDDEGTNQPKKEEDILIIGQSVDINLTSNIRVKMRKEETLQKVRRRLAVKLFKPATHFHVFYEGQELEPEACLHTVLKVDKRKQNFEVLLKAF